jgi:pimeloyl-ACP methyl ester carboxylesterase
MPLQNGKFPLVLAHPLCSNRTTLAGLIHFLSDYYDVYAIELPGFSRSIPPLKAVSIENLASFFAHEVRKLRLTSYILAGISFGFLVVNQLPPPPECRAIFAISPFIGAYALRKSRISRYLLQSALSVVLASHLEEEIWNSRWFSSLIRRSSRRERYTDLLPQIDARTFFILSQSLLRWNSLPTLHNVPYVLWANQHDSTVDYVSVTHAFRSAHRLLQLEHHVEHSPVAPSAQYFADRIAVSDFPAIAQFLRIA